MPNGAFSGPVLMVRVARAVALAAALGSIVWLLLGAFQPLRLNWGDPWSDANVLTTLEYSAKYGFWKTSFTDVLDIGPLSAESYRYTHYPPLAEITYGLVRKVAGKADIGLYRVFAIGFSFATLYFVNAYVTRLFGGLAAACATTFFATNALFLQYADSIHQAPLLGCTSFAALTVTARFVEDGRRRDLWLIALCTFLSFMTAYDFYFFLPLAGLGTAWLFGKRLFERATLSVAVAIALGGALALVLKSLFVVGALGWDGFKGDFVFQFFERASTKYSVDYRFGLAKVVAARLFLYMTPFFFALLVAQLATGWRLLRGTAPTERRRSFAAPLVFLGAGVPFLVVFSQLTATQVLPMQCLVPYYAVGFGVLVARLLASSAQRRMLGIALGVVLVGSQVLHIATFEKSFLDDDDRKKVAAYLDAHDENDFVFTNLLSDGPIQYYFQRHLQPIDAHWPPGSYRTLLRRIGPDRMHLVIFEDPNSCFVDKSLFPLLAGDSRWTTIGAPPLNRMAALEAISAFDRDVHKTFALEATLALRAGRISVYSIGSAEILALLRGSPQLAHVTEHIDFAEHTSNDFKIYGMRGPEPGKPYSWSIHRRRARTVLTRTGVVWSDGAPVLEVGLLLNLPAGADYRITLHALTNVPDQTLGAMIGDRVLMPPAPLAPPWTSQAFTFTVPKDSLGSDPVVTLRFPYAARGLAKEAVAVDGEVPDVGVAFESLDAVPLP